MKCEKCGEELTNGDKFCQNCGAPINDGNANLPNNNLNQGYQNNQSFNNGMNGNFGNQGFNNNTGMYGNGFNGQGQITKGYNNNTARIILICGIVLFSLAIAAVAFIFLTKTEKPKYNRSSYGSTSEGTTQTVSNNYTAYLGNFKLQIPSNMIYEKRDYELILYDSTNSWAIKIAIIDLDYAQVKSNLGQFKTSAESQGLTITTPVEKTQGGVNFITFETVESGYNELCAVAKADINSSFGISIITQDNKIDYSILSKVAPIISSAQNTGGSSNSIKFNDDFNAIKKVVPTE